jgi:hypothetical protein
MSGLAAAPPSMPWMMRSLRDARRCPRRMAARATRTRFAALHAGADERRRDAARAARERAANAARSARGLWALYRTTTGRTECFGVMGKRGGSRHTFTRAFGSSLRLRSAPAQHSTAQPQPPRLKTPKKVVIETVSTL